MDDGLAGLAGLHGRIADARRQFYAERERLEECLGRAFDDPASASDVLLSLAEEYGPEQAVALLRERPFDVGELKPNPDIEDGLEERLSSIMQTQDGLDDLTAERESHSNRESGSRILNIQGDEHLLVGKEVRALVADREETPGFVRPSEGQQLAEPRTQQEISNIRSR